MWAVFCPPHPPLPVPVKGSSKTPGRGGDFAPAVDAVYKMKVKCKSFFLHLVAYQVFSGFARCCAGRENRALVVLQHFKP